MTLEKKTLLDVEGMTCGSCVRHIDKTMADLEGVREIDVRMRDGQVLVRHDPDKTSVKSLVDALASAGYISRATA